MFNAKQGLVPAKTCEVRGAEGGETPEEIEARRQMGIALINEMLKE